MNGLIERYKSFLDEGKTERECVRRTIALAEANGYRRLESVDSLKCGDKVYVEDYEKAIALFHIGSEPMEKGMNILGAHIDSPRLDIKMNPLYESEGLVYLDTHYYGGIKKYQWVAMPLAIHGVVVKTTGEKINVVLGEEDDEFTFTISDILPHIAQEQMKKSAGEFIPGEDLDLVVGLGEKDEEGKSKAKEAILSILKEKYGIEEKDFLSSELEVVPAGKAKYLGLDSSMVLGYGQDDRICAFTSLEALLEGKTEKRTSVCILVDKEEIGSEGASGMASSFFENTVAELIEREGRGGARDIDVRRALEASTMLSADVTAAADPHFPDVDSTGNEARLGKGPAASKYTGGATKAGASDCRAEFVAEIRRLMAKGEVDWQMAELGRQEKGGGGTIAKFMARFGMDVLDFGTPLLNMHAPWELASKHDCYHTKKAYAAFFAG